MVPFGGGRGPGGKPDSPPAIVIFYTRRDCHLCSIALAVVEEVRRRIPFELTRVDVDDDPELAGRFGGEVPVVFVNGRKAFKYRVDARTLERKLQEG